MRAVDLIAAKRAGLAHTEDDIRWLVSAYMRDDVPDYQISAWLMAVCWRGLTADETRALTLALADSGRRLDFRDFPWPIVDKHSTGGVGDKTTLVLMPMLAAAGVGVAKMSGRGLGHTGGTIDKLESIPGLSTSVDPERFVAAVREHGLVVAAQSPDLAPADGRLYALRDVTATVESVPLIASSVMSKKIATGAQAVVLDVKVGSGAFMKDVDSARALARTMVDLGRATGLKTVAVLTDMSIPLGAAIGNALEVREAVETLSGDGPSDLVELCCVLGREVLVAAGFDGTPHDAELRLRHTIDDRSALAALRRLVESMGGDVGCVDDPGRLPAAPHRASLKSVDAGYVAGVDALVCGEVAMRLGAGRATKEDAIDPAVGLMLRVKTGERVTRGSTLAEIHARSQPSVDLLDQLRAAFTLTPAPPPPSPLVLDIIR